MVKAAKDDAGEVDRLCEVAHQRALDAHHVPPAEGKQTCKIIGWKYAALLVIMKTFYLKTQHKEALRGKQKVRFVPLC